MSAVAVLDQPAQTLSGLTAEMIRARIDEAFLVEPIRKKLERKLAAELIDPAIEGYKQFMTLIGLGYRGLEMRSDPVDEVWHTHVLFSRDYAAFCQQVFGRFVHHQPYSAYVSADERQASRSRFFDAYAVVFGELTPIWRIESSSKCNDTNCQDHECNDSLCKS